MFTVITRTSVLAMAAVIVAVVYQRIDVAARAFGDNQYAVQKSSGRTPRGHRELLVTCDFGSHTVNTTPMIASDPNESQDGTFAEHPSRQHEDERRLKRPNHDATTMLVSFTAL